MSKMAAAASQLTYPLGASGAALVYFGTALFFVLLLILVSFAIAWRKMRRRHCPSPYTGNPLRRGTDLHYEAVGKVLRYLYSLHEYDNRIFDIEKAAYCRETGRIFPRALNWFNAIQVDWSFLQKRYPGNYVSWGSLSEEQKSIIQNLHASLEGYQIQYSSPQPSPKKIDPKYAYTKPGPLYVDLETGILLGWKIVPDTDLEVLIVQKPLKRYLPGL